MAGHLNQAASEALGLAWSLGWRVAVGAWIGYRLDLWLGTGGLLALVLAVAAMTTGVRAMIRAGRMDSDRPDSEGEDP